jgi:peroxiredoxin
VRWLAVLTIVLGGAAHAGPPSNPAFLGISMIDARAQHLPVDGCFVEEVTPSSAAEAADLHRDDVIQALDGVMTANCNRVTAEIVAHSPGDLVRLEILRGTERVTLRATLTTRAELLHRRLVGRPFESAEAIDVDDHTAIDLADLRGDITILAWFDKRCTDCVTVIRRLGDAVQAPRKSLAQPRLLALTPGTVADLSAFRSSLNLGVPLAAVDTKTFEYAATKDSDRVFITVVDRRGHVCFVTPIAPQDDSLDAVFDEVLAAAEQAEHARVRR